MFADYVERLPVETFKIWLDVSNYDHYVSLILLFFIRIFCENLVIHRFCKLVTA